MQVYIRAGMYYYALKDWLKVFPREQFYIQRAEDYYKNRSRTLPEIFQFLGLGKNDN